MFGAGTACIVCPIKNIHFNGKDIAIPEHGELAPLFNQEILNIQYGKTPHPWSVLVN